MMPTHSDLQRSKAGLNVPNRDTLPKLTSDNLPSRAYFSLAQAAEIAGCTNADLLHYGGRGKIRLCVPIPTDAKVHSVLPENSRRTLTDVEGGKLEGSQGVMEPIDLEMVFIKPIECRAVEYGATIQQSTFDAGWFFNAQSYPMPRTPISPTEKRNRLAGLTRRKFVIYRDSQPHALMIHQSTIFVMVLDLERFLNGQQVEALENISANKEDDRRWETEELRYLIQASRRFFQNAAPNDRDTVPSKDEVVAWLCRDDVFTPSLAKHADSIIRPLWAKKRGGRPQNSQ